MKYNSNRVSYLFKSFDKFGSSPNFNARSGLSTFTTYPGAVISLIIYGLLSIYAQQKFFTMLDYSDTAHQTVTAENAIPGDELITLNYD